VLTLTTSWRNRPEILAVANGVSAPLRAAGARVAELAAAGNVPAPLGGSTAGGTRAGTVTCALLETYADEAAWIADSVVAAWRAAAAGAPAPGRAGARNAGRDTGRRVGNGVADGGAAGGEPRPGEIPVELRPTTAVLVRVRSQIAPIEAALRARGVPVEVVGLGGLLDTPEVRDVVCTLRVLADPTDGAALLRLLTGARWRIGPRDLVALHRRARAIAAGRRKLPRSGSAADDEPEIAPDRLDEATLVEALADLGPPQAYSDSGYARMRAYALELALLRHRLDQPLPDLISDVERTIGLDVEVAVRAGTAGDAGLARGHLNALGDVAARFAGEAEGPTLSAFLAFLAAAESEERGLAQGEVDVVEGAVQILTAHAAKGLEWDVVAVAGLTENVWPGPPKASDHYLRGIGVLPFPLRGDRDGLPRLALETATDSKGVNAAVAGFTQHWRAHDEREERRLAYVAVTRPRRLLLCSAHWWGEKTRKPRGPSAFLIEVYERCVDGAGVVDVWTSPPEPDAENPMAADVARAQWPADPLGGRRPALAEAAGLVRQFLLTPPEPTGAAAAEGAAADAAAPNAAAGAVGSGTTADPWADDIARWRQEADLLLAERERRAHRAGPVPVALPGHLSVSQLVTLRRDPHGLARSLRRPLPSRPDPYARRGTAFHAWLEQRFGADRLLDVDSLPGAADEDASPDEALAELQERFLTSEWADRTPIEVEVPFATVIGGVVVRGRMDAVFAGVGGLFDVVDWKTGRRPDQVAAASAAVQLAAYRLAWAALAGVPVDRVRAAFHYVREGVTVRPADLLDADGLTALITDVPEG
jgi:DNA helicase-2/ATP-dependent DNA helicase PcrA